MVGTKPTFTEGPSDLRKERIDSTVRCKTREDLERAIADDMFKGSEFIQSNSKLEESIAVPELPSNLILAWQSLGNLCGARDVNFLLILFSRSQG